MAEVGNGEKLSLVFFFFYVGGGVGSKGKKSGMEEGKKNGKERSQGRKGNIEYFLSPYFSLCTLFT